MPTKQAPGIIQVARASASATPSRPGANYDSQNGLEEERMKMEMKDAEEDFFSSYSTRGEQTVTFQPGPACAKPKNDRLRG